MSFLPKLNMNLKLPSKLLILFLVRQCCQLENVKILLHNSYFGNFITLINKTSCIFHFLEQSGELFYMHNCITSWAFILQLQKFYYTERI